MKSGIRKDKRSFGSSMVTAQGGPAELDATGRYLGVVHLGRNVQVWDLERQRAVLTVVVDPNVSNEESLQGLSRIPRFVHEGGGILRRTGSSPTPPHEKLITCLAVSEKTSVALGYADVACSSSTTTPAR